MYVCIYVLFLFALLAYPPSLPPSLPHNKKHRGYALMMLGKYDWAVKCLKVSLELNPNQLAVLQCTAFCYIKMRDPTQALVCVRRERQGREERKEGGGETRVRSNFDHLFRLFQFLSSSLCFSPLFLPVSLIFVHSRLTGYTKRRPSTEPHGCDNTLLPQNCKERVCIRKTRGGRERGEERGEEEETNNSRFMFSFFLSLLLFLFSQLPTRTSNFPL